MFTGIVEHVGRVAAVARDPESGIVRFGIEVGPIAEGVKLGDSVAVMGACLTATAIETIDGECRISFEAIPETLARTRLGTVAVGAAVNLERAMSANARFDGHIVQGHVDGIGTVRRFTRNDLEAGQGIELHVRCDPELAGQLVDKGSVTVDGVSLTVAGVVSDGFHVALIPHTLEVTTLSELEVGESVNLEVDVFGKYVKQYLDRILPGLVGAAGTVGEDASD